MTARVLAAKMYYRISRQRLTTINFNDCRTYLSKSFQPISAFSRTYLHMKNVFAPLYIRLPLANKNANHFSLAQYRSQVKYTTGTSSPLPLFPFSLQLLSSFFDYPLYDLHPLSSYRFLSLYTLVICWFSLYLFLYTNFSMHFSELALFLFPYTLFLFNYCIINNFFIIELQIFFNYAYKYLVDYYSIISLYF